MAIDYEKMYRTNEQKPPVAVEAPPPPLPDLPDSKNMVERIQAMENEIVTAYRQILNDPNQPASARVSAANALTDRGWGKATTDAPPVKTAESAKDLAARVLAMLTDKQLEELRAYHDTSEEVREPVAGSGGVEVSGGVREGSGGDSAASGDTLGEGGHTGDESLT